MEEADERVTTRAAVKPQSDGIIRRVVSRLKEPEESVHILSEVNVTGVTRLGWFELPAKLPCFVESEGLRVDARSGLADAILARLLVS